MKRLVCVVLWAMATGCGEPPVAPEALVNLEASWSSDRIAADSALISIDFDATQSDAGVLTGCAVLRSSITNEEAIGVLSGSVTATRVMLEVEWEYNRVFLFRWSFESDAVEGGTLSGVSNLLEVHGTVVWPNQPTLIRRTPGGPGIFCGWQRPPEGQ